MRPSSSPPPDSVSSRRYWRKWLKSPKNYRLLAHNAVADRDVSQARSIRIMVSSPSHRDQERDGRDDSTANRRFDCPAFPPSPQNRADKTPRQEHPFGFCTQRLSRSHAPLRLPPHTPRLASFRSGFGSGVQCMEKISHRIAQFRDAA